LDNWYVPATTTGRSGDEPGMSGEPWPAADDRVDDRIKKEDRQPEYRPDG
jgi:hypothetical protein